MTKMSILQSELHPKSFVSNFWGAVQYSTGVFDRKT